MGLLLTSPRALVRRTTAWFPGAGAVRASPLAGQRVLITGASSGIGEATAHAVAARGAVVLLLARRREELGRVAGDIALSDLPATASVHVYPCDLTDPLAIEAVIAGIKADHGGVDAIVNNAGRSIRRSLRLSYDRMHDFERTMELNYYAPVRLILGFAPEMVAQGHGHIVNILTWGVQIKAPKFAAYIASKTALDVFSRVAGREFYGDGITFTNVRMPLVRTAMIGPTDAYENAPALSPEQAAALVVRALEDRPLTLDTAAGKVLELFNLAAPRLSDAVIYQLSRHFPDSKAAGAEARH